MGCLFSPASPTLHNTGSVLTPVINSMPLILTQPRHVLQFKSEGLYLVNMAGGPEQTGFGLTAFPQSTGD